MPAANKFVLKGPGVEVDYTIGATPAIPALVYTAGAFQKKFKPNEVLSEDTGLGRLVSVALILTMETFSGPDSVPHRPSTWRCIEMTGTAQSVIVPL